MEQVARRHLQEAGASHEVSVELGIFSYPDRRYRGLLVPGGEYLAVEVRLGSGSGQNFWCILFPSMCFLPEEVQELAGQRARGNVAEAAPARNDASDEGIRSLTAPRVGWLWLQRIHEGKPLTSSLQTGTSEQDS